MIAQRESITPHRVSPQLRNANGWPQRQDAPHGLPRGADVAGESLVGQLHPGLVDMAGTDAENVLVKLG